MRVRLGAFRLGVLIAALPLLTCSSARAGTATIHQCTTPSGQVAATDMLRPPAPALMSAGLFCGTPALPWGIMLRRGSGGNYDGMQVGELLVSGPSGTALRGGQIERQMLGYVFRQSAPEATFGFGYRLMTAAGATIEMCGSWWEFQSTPGHCTPGPSGTWQFANGTVTVPPTPTGYLRIALGCYPAGGHCTRSSSEEALGIRRLSLRVDDHDAPTVTSAIGAVASEQPVRTRTLAVNAADHGLGLYRLLVSVDGRYVEALPFAPAATGCRDADPRNSDPYEFTSATACPTGSTSSTFSLSSLPPTGEHRVRIEVEDAAGNRTATLERLVTFDLPADGLRCPATNCVGPLRPLNGTNATTAARLTAAVKSKPRARIAYAARTAIAGRLIDNAGAPIAGATIDVFATDNGAAAAQPAGSAVTRSTGAFRYVPPAGPSRRLRFEYRTRLGDSSPAASADFELQVRAAPTMTLRPARVRPGGSVRVRGRLRGRGVPAGTLVELQALDGREWRTFKTLTTRKGRFAYRYRFRHTSGGARFLWRIHVRPQPGLPYVAGSSRPAWVVVR